MAHEEKGVNLDFENGGFWEYYKDLERQFESFLEYVPYLKGNEDTYSFRLANIILAIGAHIDSAFKEMARCDEFEDKEPCKEILKRTEDKKGIIISAVRAFDEIYGLTSKKVTFKCLPDRKEITPFKGNKPEWWDSYNDIKHDITTNLTKANLRNVRDALAGAFLLNVIFEPATYRLFKYGLVKQKYQTDGYEKIPTFVRGMSREPKYEAFSGCINEYLIETPLFIYEYEYEKSS